jgi:hypothetical protein
MSIYIKTEFQKNLKGNEGKVTEVKGDLDSCEYTCRCQHSSIKTDTSTKQ